MSTPERALARASGTPSNLRYDARGVEAIHRQLGGNVESAREWLEPVTPEMPNHRLINEPVAVSARRQTYN